MTGPAVPATEQGPEPGPPRLAGPGIGRAAALIAALTVLARLIGLGRQLVFAHTVGSACLGTAYTTANLVPNVIYDIVLGGALTGLVVPLLARPAVQSGAGQSGAVRCGAVRCRAGLGRPGRRGRGQPDLLGAADLDRGHPAARQRGGRGGRCPGGLAAGAGQPARLPAGRGGLGRRPDAGRVRAADPAVRPGRGAVRDPAGAPAVHRPGAGAGAVQPGGDRGLPRVRAARRPAHHCSWPGSRPRPS